MGFAMKHMSTMILMACQIATVGICRSDDLEVQQLEPPITASDRDHWSLKPLRVPDIPTTAFSHWQRNPIDAFIAAGVERAGLTPQPEADRRTLIRRITLNLTGLPPTPDAVAEFLGSSSPLTFEELTDRLLASPAYGERWAQHWLDLARFAETDGFEHDNIRPNAFRYRDWVIDAMNIDMPYDTFIKLQIAGDLLEPDNESAIVATQFCLSGPDMPDINSQEERRHTLLNEITATVGEVILGLQIGCAQCHDHKYDPVSQADFYRLRAVFEPAIRLKKNASITELKEQFPYQSASFVMQRGDYRRPGEEIAPGVPRVLQSELLDYSPSPNQHSDGRRIALANWLVNPHHPLTSRVIVNRIWQQHFGTGLCESPSDFGVMGMEPSNGELLDWLADWFVHNDWSIKRLHRLIVTSATWRQRSRLPSGACADEKLAWNKSLQSDRDNRLLSRFPRQRLTGEVIRDLMLSVAGTLNLKTGGPGIRPPLPAELRNTLLKDQWNVTEDAREHHRRSIYVFARRNLRFPIFEAFDRPAANQSCSRRTNSTMAPQALHLLNSEFSWTMAMAVATRIQEHHMNADEQIHEAFRRILNRPPTADEQTAALRFVEAADDNGLTHLSLSLMNCNEFVFVD